MKKLKLYQADAFAGKLFQGNPAAVCPLDEWLPKPLMQSIAAENNLAETAFYVRDGNEYDLKWFTPVSEVDLCGHATLATAHILFNHEGYTGSEITFRSNSGRLTVKRSNDLLTLDFPSDHIEKVDTPPAITSALNIPVIETWKGRMDYMAVLSSQSDLEKVQPDFRLIATLGTRGLIITAKGNEVDFVSRYFAPQFGIDEDPVTGSAHTTLIPYWSARLNKIEMKALQLSKRRGELGCKHLGDRVEISGKARTYLAGEIYVE